MCVCGESKQNNVCTHIHNYTYMWFLRLADYSNNKNIRHIKICFHFHLQMTTSNEPEKRNASENECKVNREGGRSTYKKKKLIKLKLKLTHFNCMWHSQWQCVQIVYASFISIRNCNRPKAIQHKICIFIKHN